MSKPRCEQSINPVASSPRGIVFSPTIKAMLEESSGVEDAEVLNTAAGMFSMVEACKLPQSEEPKVYKKSI